MSGFRRLWRIDQGDAQLAIVGFAAVALLGVLPGIAIAVIASLLALVRRVYRPRVAVLGRAAGETSADEDYRFRSIDRHPEYETIPGLVLFRFSNELFFANASFFRDETLRLVAEADPPARTVLVDASAISHLDTTAVAMLEDLIDRLDRSGRHLRARPHDGRAQRRPGAHRAPGADRTRPAAPIRSHRRGVLPPEIGVAASRAVAQIAVASPGRSTRTSVAGACSRIACSKRAGGVSRKSGGPCSPRWIG